MFSTLIVIVTVGVSPGAPPLFVATLPTSTTVPGCTDPSGNSTSMVAPSLNVASPIGAVVVTRRDGAVNDITTLSPASTVPSGTNAGADRQAGRDDENEPAGMTRLAGSAVTPSEANHAAAAVAVCRVEVIVDGHASSRP